MRGSERARSRQPSEGQRPLASVQRAFRSPGQPLAIETRVPMDQRFGFDFGNVRVHADEPAAASARQLHAAAWTSGRDIFFGAGRYAPETPAGRRLLAHELAHVVQQGGRVAPLGSLWVASADDACEREADAAAADVEAGPAGRARPVARSEATGAIQRSGVSYELGDPPDVGVEELAKDSSPEELAAYNALNVDERKVMGWLRQWRQEIVNQEVLRGVDRRAIAGAIAWEALENVASSSTLSRAAGGPGKIHAWTSHVGWESREAAPAEVEARGLVPRQTMDDRVAILKTPKGSIEYIGAIMEAMAHDAATVGFDIWRNPQVLTWGYQSKYVDTFNERMVEKSKAGETAFDTSSSTMATWVGQHVQYLELAVGPAGFHNPIMPKGGVEPAAAPPAVFGGVQPER